VFVALGACVAVPFVTWAAMREPPVPRPTEELDQLDALLTHSAIPMNSEVRSRAIRVRGAVRRVDLRLGLLRDYAAARDSVVAAVRDLEPLVDEAAAHSRRRLDAVETAGRDLAELTRLLDGVTLGADLRRALFAARARHTEAQDLLRADRETEAAAALDAANRRLRAIRDEARGLLARYADEGEIRRWNDWIDDAVSASRRSGGVAMVVDKDLRRLTLYRAGRVVSEHRVDLGANASGVKLHQGDRATPEGTYRVVERKDRGASRYGRALLLDYPNRDDRARLQRAIDAGEVRRGTAPGGLIEIHGAGGRSEDWTDGCVAVSDAEMTDLFAQAPLGTVVVIVGGDGSGPWAAAARRLADDR
jgi:lipoprotein-anchoring transpeptidase ErfK/SrfK